MNILLLTILLTLSGKEGTKAMPVVDECKNMVIEAYSKIVDMQKGNSMKTQLLTYKTTVFYKAPGESKLQTSVSTAKMVSNGVQSYFDSDDAEIAKDKKTVVTVLKRQRQIYITHATPLEGLTSNQLETVRDLLLRQAQLTACITADGTKTKEVSFSLPEKIVSQYQIKNMKFWVAATSKKVKKIELQYTPGQPLERHIVEFLNYDNDAQPIKRFKNSTDIIRDIHGKLLPAYQGYRILDTRTTN